jgi:hypothetical protein
LLLIALPAGCCLLHPVSFFVQWLRGGYLLIEIFLHVLHLAVSYTIGNSIAFGFGCFIGVGVNRASCNYLAGIIKYTLN